MNNFLLEWYYKEDERKYALDNSLNIPIGILTGLVAGIYYLISKYNYQDENIYLKMAFIACIAATVTFWLISIVYVLLSYNGIFKSKKYTYRYFPCTDFVEKEEDKLKPYYENHKDYFTANNITFEMLLAKNVDEILSSCINRNMSNNDRKANYLYKSKIHLINCTATIFLTGIFFSVNYIQHEKQEIYNIKIMNQRLSGGQTPTPPPPPPRPQEPREVSQGGPIRTNSPKTGK